MSESVRDLLRQSADTVERPQMDVHELVARAEQRMHRRRLATAGASALAVAAIVAGGVALRPDDARPDDTPLQPVESPRTSDKSSQSSTPSDPEPSTPPVATGPIHGWPTTTRNPAGAYSWDGSTCAGQTCIVDFMHNGYGAGGATINIKRAEGPAPSASEGPDGWTPVTIAGQEGLHRQVNPREETWRFELAGTPMEIRLTTKPRAKQAEIDEARAIIASMYPEERDNQLGWRLVFTLTTNDWDSG